MGDSGMAVWLRAKGSGSAASVLAEGVAAQLSGRGASVLVVDRNLLEKVFETELGSDRALNARRINRLAELLFASRDVILVALPQAEAEGGAGLVEVFDASPVENDLEPVAAFDMAQSSLHQAAAELAGMIAGEEDSQAAEEAESIKSRLSDLGYM